MRRRLFGFTFIAWLFGCLAIFCNAQQPEPVKLDPKVYDSYLGTYRLASGELIVIGRSQYRLHYYEPQTGRFRGLQQQAGSAFAAGPSLLVYSPMELQIRFLKNRKGKVTSLVVKEQNSAEKIAKKANLYKGEKVTFRNGDAALSGTLLVPDTRGPHPALILLHGSGPQDRNGFLSIIRLAADHFARHGIAAFIYDKRGVGASTGNWATAGFDDMAGDAVAALKMLQNRSDINPKQIGMWGSSQAAWVMAKATSLSKDIAFIINESGGGSGYTVAQQNNYNTAAEMKANGFSQNEIEQVIEIWNIFYDIVRAGEGGNGEKLDTALRQARQSEKLKDWLPPSSGEVDWRNKNQWFLALDIDFDPVPLWAKYNGPVLGIFGELDNSTPVRQVVPIFEQALASRKNKDYTIKIFPKAHHIMLEAETGSDAELPRLKRFVPGYFDAMSDWLQKRVKIPK